MFYLRLFIFSVGMGLIALNAAADPLTISYLNPNQTATIGATGFVTVTFFGTVTNTSNSAVAFELSGGPQPFEPYVAGFISGVPFPGETLAPGASTGVFALATVTLNPFDPSLAYPGLVNIVLPAVGATGNTLGASTASIEVLHAVPEPTELRLLFWASGLPLIFFSHGKKAGMAALRAWKKSRRTLQNPYKSL
jgi:hypothetical protein